MFERDDRRAVLIVTLVWMAAIVAAAPLGDFPINDDWSWALAVKALVVDHTWRLTDFTGMPLATQIVWGALFSLPAGFSFVALRVSTLVLAWAGIVGVYTLLRVCGSRRDTAALGAMGTALCPLFFALSLTFMTDVPFLTLSVWAVIAAIEYERTPSRGRLMALVALVVAATLLRQLGAALAVALGAGVAVSSRRFRAAAAVALVPAAALAAYYRVIKAIGEPYYFHSRNAELLATILHPSWRLTAQTVVKAIESGVYVGVLLAPVVLAVRWRRVNALSVAAGILVAAIPAAVVLRTGRGMPLFKSVLWDIGLNPVVIEGDRYWPAAPPWVWAIVTVAGIAAGAIVCVAVGRDIVGRLAARRTDRARSGAFLLVALALGAMLVPVWFVPVFDRYFIAPFVLTFVLFAMAEDTGRNAARPSAAQLGAAAIVLGTVWLFDVAAVHDCFAFNRARWAAVRDLETSGLAGRDIDGGFEVNGLLSYTPDERVREDGAWYLPKRHPVAMLSLGPVDGYQRSATYPFRRWLPPGPGAVWVMRPAGP